MSNRRRLDEVLATQSDGKELTKAQPKHVNDSDTVSSPNVSAISFGERLLTKHLAHECFQSGVNKRVWRVVEIGWPYAVFGLMIDRTGGRLGEATVRLHLQRYPIEPPLVELWNARKCSPVDADLWPRWYVHFVSESFPHLVGVPITAFKPEVLVISTAIACRLRNSANCEGWDQGGDVTQILVRLLICLRRSETKVDARRKVSLRKLLQGSLQTMNHKSTQDSLHVPPSTNLKKIDLTEK